MKKIIVAVDSFKGSLNTFESGKAVKTAAHKVFNDAEVIVSPVADGGEGTLDAIISAISGKMTEVVVSDPLGKKIKAEYGIASETAVIEMASAAGITLIKDNERNPLYTTTYGVGEMIADAVNKGCRKFIIGIGGSATNDGGAGMLQALGFEFLDKNGKQIKKGAEGLKDLTSINISNAMPELKECTFSVACDVTNVLCGDNGCSKIYGPQKGADEEMIALMDLWLEKYAELTKTVIPGSDKNTDGAGAAGGMGFALLSYLGAKLESGIKLVIRETGLENHIKDADLVVTGEGRLDGQSYMGKAPIGVARVAKKYNVPVIAFCGCVSEDATICNEYGIDAFFPILRKPSTLEEAMNIENAYENLCGSAEQVFKLIKTVK